MVKEGFIAFKQLLTFHPEPEKFGGEYLPVGERQ